MAGFLASHKTNGARLRRFGLRFFFLFLFRIGQMDFVAENRTAVLLFVRTIELKHLHADVSASCLHALQLRNEHVEGHFVSLHLRVVTEEQGDRENCDGSYHIKPPRQRWTHRCQNRTRQCVRRPFPAAAFLQETLHEAEKRGGQARDRRTHHQRSHQQSNSCDVRAREPFHFLSPGGQLYYSIRGRQNQPLHKISITRAG